MISSVDSNQLTSWWLILIHAVSTIYLETCTFLYDGPTFIMKPATSAKPSKNAASTVL